MKSKIPWYLKHANMFMSLLVAGCFVVGGCVAYTIANLFLANMENAAELMLTAVCLFTVSVGGVGGYLWLVKKSEEFRM